MAYKRKYKLTIGAPAKLSESLYKNGKFQSTMNLEDYVQKHQNDNAFIITEHQIDFNIEIDDTKFANNGDITITNLDDFIVDYLDANSNNNIICKLEAGYEDEGMTTLMVSYIDFFEDHWQGNTRTTKLNFGDGSSNIKNAHTSRSYPKGTKLKTILKDLSTDLGLPVGSISTVADSTVVNGDVNPMGKTNDQIATLCKQYQISHHIQNGKVYFIKDGDMLNSTVGYYITPASGLIDSPSRFSHTRAKKKWEKDPNQKGSQKLEIQGVSFECLLNGALVVGSAVYIQDDKSGYDGAYKVSKVTHSGSYYGGDWKTTIECNVTEKTIASPTSKKK